MFIIKIENEFKEKEILKIVIDEKIKKTLKIKR
jgi:hypothetical protein